MDQLDPHWVDAGTKFLLVGMELQKLFLVQNVVRGYRFSWF